MGSIPTASTNSMNSNRPPGRGSVPGPGRRFRLGSTVGRAAARQAPSGSARGFAEQQRQSRCFPLEHFCVVQRRPYLVLCRNSSLTAGDERSVRRGVGLDELIVRPLANDSPEAVRPEAQEVRGFADRRGSGSGPASRRAWRERWRLRVRSLETRLTAAEALLGEHDHGPVSPPSRA